jgi:hypothetical protein
LKCWVVKYFSNNTVIKWKFTWCENKYTKFYEKYKCFKLFYAWSCVINNMCRILLIDFFTSFLWGIDRLCSSFVTSDSRWSYFILYFWAVEFSKLSLKNLRLRRSFFKVQSKFSDFLLNAERHFFSSSCSANINSFGEKSLKFYWKHWNLTSNVEKS